MKDLATRQLTDLQAAFVRRMAIHGDKVRAVGEAGYTSGTPASVAVELLRLPHVVASIQQEVRRQLVMDGAMARRVIQEIAENETFSPKVRLDAAKTLLDRAGHVAPRAVVDKSGTETPLHEMSTDELRTLAGRLEDEIAGRAKPISASPVPTETQAVDLVG